MKQKFVITAKKIAREAHSGQFRKDGVTPYIVHLERVAKCFAEAPDFEAVAWLHDVMEDNPMITADYLLSQGIPEWVVKAVQAITKQEDEDYNTYLNRVKDDNIALYVKIKDILDNLSDGPSENKRKTYIAGLKFLTDFLPIYLYV